MRFNKDAGVPPEIESVGLGEWYESLNDQDKMRLCRYLDGVDSDSSFAFFYEIAERSLSDENYKFAVLICVKAYDFEMTDYQMFLINEKLIDAYFGAERYEDVKAACETNFSLYPAIKDDFISDNDGKLPEKINFRNKYIDVLVGIDNNYDLANEMLRKYNAAGLIDDSELEYRLNSLKTHRLQRIFDGVYTYRPAGEDL